jgi:hypothetical protein
LTVSAEATEVTHSIAAIDSPAQLIQIGAFFMLFSLYFILKLKVRAGSGESPSQCIKMQSGNMFRRSSENLEWRPQSVAPSHPLRRHIY